ncbi:MAG: S8 family serine peptidase [Deltaproteobacteria bacterium]
MRLVEPDAPRTAAVPKRSSAWSLSTLARFGGPVAAVLAAVSFGTSVAARPPTIESEATCPADEEALARARAAKRAPYGVAARQLAAEALAPKTRPSGEHPLMKHRAEVTRRLELLGLFKASGDHVHISDVDLEHGGAVLRAAVGLVPLVKTVTSTMSVDGVPEEFAKSKLSPSQFERYRAVYEEGDEGPPPSFEVLVQGAADELERMMLEKRLRTLQLAAQRERLPEAKRIFVNMSFGQSPDRMAKTIAEEVLSAPPGSPLHALAKETLGEAPVVIPEGISFEPPPFSRCDEPFEVGPDDAPWEGPPADLPEFDFEKMEAQVEALKQRLAYPALMKVMQTTDFRARMDTARAELTTALFEAQKVGILVFEAAGNEYADAKRSGRPELSKSGSTGTRGLLRIGALDLGRLADPRDDRVATFSAAGRIALAAQGTKLPVWIQMGEVEESEGTSFASPLALGVGLATAANAKDADVTPAGITKLLTDPRAVHDIRGTERDGAGALDDFAAILLAANPKLERATIDRAWKMLGAKDADVPAVKRLLGLR